MPHGDLVQWTAENALFSPSIRDRYVAALSDARMGPDHSPRMLLNGSGVLVVDLDGVRLLAAAPVR